MKRRLIRLMSALLLFACCVLPLSGCVWLQNEFFVYERATPSADPSPTATVPTTPW